jgi:hypothetical protein
MNEEGSVGIVTGHGLNNRMIRVQFLVGGGNFFVRHHTQTGCEPTQPLIPGTKAAGA